jgi:hypothetical protein
MYLNSLVPFFVFEKNAVKVWNLLGNALEKLWLIKSSWFEHAIRLKFGRLIIHYLCNIMELLTQDTLDLAFQRFGTNSSFDHEHCSSAPFVSIIAPLGAVTVNG